MGTTNRNPRHMWSDYAMQARVTAHLIGQQVDAESSLMKLAHKNRKRALSAYVASLVTMSNG
jgi:hypothetical protein